MADDQLQKLSTSDEATIGSTGDVKDSKAKFSMVGKDAEFLRESCLAPVLVAENSTSQESSKQQLEFSKDEETLIIRMYNLVGERWSLIAGRIPGRSADEIENYWKSKHSTGTDKQESENSNFLLRGKSDI